MFIIDIMSRTPVYEQIINEVENYILTGVMKPGDKMPSVRSVSVSCSVNPNTIQKAYTELDRKGLIVSVPGKGSFISDNAKEILGVNSRQKLESMKELLEELKLAGVSQEEVIELVKEVYGKEVAK